MSLVNSIGEHLIQDFQEDMEPMVDSSSIMRWNYSISKLADEAFGLSYSKKFGMNVTCDNKIKYSSLAKICNL